jgi:hypothetical protein
MKGTLRKMGFPLFIAAILILLFSVLFVLVAPKMKMQKIAFWKAFLEPGYPTLVVLGDHYFFNDSIATGRIGISRDTRINSDEDLDNFLKEHPELINRIRKNKMTYINKQAPVGLFNVMQILGGDRAETEMKFSSQLLKWDDLFGKHLIFIGSVKTLGFLNNTVEKLGLKYDLSQSSFLYQTGDSTLNFRNRSDNYLQNEHACLIRFETNDGRNVLFLLSDSDIGNIAAQKFMTDLKNSELLLKKTPGKNYKAIFKVKGRELTDFQIELLRIDPITDPISDIWP